MGIEVGEEVGEGTWRGGVVDWGVMITGVFSTAGVGVISVVGVVSDEESEPPGISGNSEEQPGGNPRLAIVPAPINSNKKVLRLMPLSFSIF